MGVGHCNEAIVELVFVVAFNHKAVLNGLLPVNKISLRDDTDWEAIYLADALVLTVGISLHCQTLQMDTHILLVGEVAGIYGEIVDGVAVFVSLDDRRIPGCILFHSPDCRLIVGNIMADSLESEP